MLSGGLAVAERTHARAREGALGDTRLSDTDRPQRAGALARSEGDRSRFQLINGISERQFWARVHDRSPAYIQRCVCNPHRTQSPYLGYRWKRETHFDGLTRAPKACGSHKCPSEHCRRFASHQLYARLTEAFAKVPTRDLIFMVFTLSSHWHQPGQPKAPRYEAAHRARTLFVKRLRKWLEVNYGYQFENRNFWAVEEHRSGVPHINFVFAHEGYSKDLRSEKMGYQAGGLSPREAIRMRGEILRIAEESGFGRVCTAEACRDGEAGAQKLAGYLTKTVQGLAGEQQKKTQLPVDSPYRRRTWGAGKGFVPPKHTSNGEYTGGVVSRRTLADGDTLAEPLLRDQIPEPEYLLRVLGLPEDHPARVEAQERWDAELARKLQYREDMAFLARLEQQLAYQDEDRRRERLPLSTCERLSFRVVGNEVYDSDGRRILAMDDAWRDTGGHGENETSEQHQGNCSCHTPAGPNATASREQSPTQPIEAPATQQLGLF